MTEPVPTAPGPAPEPTDRPTGTFGVGGVLAIGGAAIVLVAAFLDWAEPGFFDRDGFTAGDIPLQFLWDTTPATFDDPSLLYPLVLAVALCVAGAFIARARWLAVIGGVIAIAVPLWFVYAVRNVLTDSLYEGAFDDGTLDFVANGVWVCLAGGVIAAVGGVLAMRSAGAGGR